MTKSIRNQGDVGYVSPEPDEGRNAPKGESQWRAVTYPGMTEEMIGYTVAQIKDFTNIRLVSS